MKQLTAQPSATLLRRSAAALFLSACAVAPAMAQGSVSIGIAQPGLYGRIDLGSYPQPPVVYAPQPVVVTPAPVAYQRQPIYLYVPPAHRANWARYCSYYAACAQPVYFARDEWVRDQWAHRDARRGDWRRDQWRERREHEHGRPGRPGDRDRDHDNRR